MNVSNSSVRPARGSDSRPLARLRAALWPEPSAEEHLRELTLILEGKAPSTMPFLILVAVTSSHELVGFLEVGLRSHADGCAPDHAVGFIEGWYVAEEVRRQGIGKQLLAAAESWARDRGCIEMGSDVWISNELAQCVHQALGYVEVDRCVHYRKQL